MTKRIEPSDTPPVQEPESGGGEEAEGTAAPIPMQKAAPSWILSHTGQQLTREELLARYRRQRALPDDPFEQTGRPVPPPGYRDKIMSEPRPAARFVERQPVEPEELKSAPRSARSFTLGQTLAIAAGVALLAGGGASLISARLSSTQQASAPVEALAAPPLADAAPAAQTLRQLQPVEAAAERSTTVDKKPVATATLDVADAEGVTNSYIPLALHAEPAGLNEDMLLKISGIPEGAYLTTGHRENDQIWSLSLADLKDLKLVVPKANQPQFDLAVAAFEPKTGELAAPVKTMTVELNDVVVQPTSAPPPGQIESSASKATLPGATGISSALPTAIPPPQSIKVALAQPESSAGVQQLISEGSSLMRTGDVRAARNNFERAWGTDGSGAAAYGLARSYDPVVLGSLTLKNVDPDKTLALQWYQRAASAGNEDAAEAIIRLQLKP
ncbi:hypothetical protein [Aestuariivirga sp.]|uniref:hypothetical protein n=1 Tax=Aestuariivirga sp. TaxID=2650926 RepID=UPI003BAB187B